LECPENFQKTLPDVVSGKTLIFRAIYHNPATNVDIIPSDIKLRRDVDLEKLKETCL